MNPAHYEKEEQFICAIEGTISLKIIPHIYRQEVYAGKDKIIKKGNKAAGEDDIKEAVKVNYSPVNFFDSDNKNYPRFNDIDKQYSISLEDGDCAYIPSFNFF